LVLILINFGFGLLGRPRSQKSSNYLRMNNYCMSRILHGRNITVDGYWSH
jgi:hypothetical protein